MNRQELARTFHSFTAISREEIFGAHEATIRPINLLDDASTMFAGYVGAQYIPNSGIAILAINPGGGGDAYTARIPEDEIFYPLLSAFKGAASADIPAAFERVNESFAGIVTGWNLWRILGPTLAAAGKSISEVSYLNVVPYRTRENKMPPVSSRRLAWSRIIAPTLDSLRPRAIITLGKKAGSVVDSLSDGRCKHYCVPRTIGDTYVSDAALIVHETIRADLNDA